MNPKYFITLVVLSVFAQPAYSVRCGHKLVSTGDHFTKVEHICGEPVAIQASTVYRSGFPRYSGLETEQSSPPSPSDQELLIHDRSVIEVQVEDWTYNFGPRRFMHSIRFENGFVIKIKSLGYGY